MSQLTQKLKQFVDLRQEVNDMLREPIKVAADLYVKWQIELCKAKGEYNRFYNFGASEFRIIHENEIEVLWLEDDGDSIPQILRFEMSFILNENNVHKTYVTDTKHRIEDAKKEKNQLIIEQKERQLQNLQAEIAKLKES